jgi:aryl-alcohol dehydrogenase-like predicted oxidoreductase
MACKLDDYRLLGRSGLRVSPLCLGTMNFGVAAAWGCEEATAATIFDQYVERGGNFIDTANFYANGESERVVGRLLLGRREQLAIATKYSLTMRPGDPNASGNQRKNMVQSVEQSLRRLQTEYIDLLYLHVWDERTPVEEILRSFDDLVRAGKVLYVGISDTPAWQASRMQAIAELRGWSPLVALQIPYSLAERTVERDLIPMAREMGMGVLPWSPLAGGVLSGKYTDKDLVAASRPADMRQGTRKDMNLATGRLTERTLAIANTVTALATEMERTPAQVALAWTLLNPAVVSPIIGVRTHAQFDDNLAALQLCFGSDQIAALDAASGIELGFPHDMLNGPTARFMFGGVNVAKNG